MSAVRALEVGEKELSLAQRAAIIISLLGEEAARPLLEKLDDEALARVQQELLHVAMLPREDILDVAREFLHHLNGSTARLFHGKNRAKTVISGIVTSRIPLEIDEDEEEIVVPQPKPEESVWDRMALRPPKMVADYLTPMTPNIISKVLRKLPPGMSSEVLNALEKDKLQGVLERLIQAAEDDEAMDTILERMVEIEFMSEEVGGPEKATEHFESVGEILSLIPAGKRDSLFEFLQRDHEDELHAIQKSLFTIGSLPTTLNAKSVPILFREIETSEMIRYLIAIKAIDPEVSDFLLSNISSRMAEQFRGEVDTAPALSDRAVANCERDFLAKLFDFKRLGKIDVIKGEPE